MAFVITSTTVINDSAQLPWSRISGTPTGYVSAVSKVYTGDGFNTNGPVQDVAFSSQTITVWIASNCAACLDCSNCSACGDGCFVKGSKIFMADGREIAIEDVKVGDQVYTLTGKGIVLKTPRYTLGVGRNIVDVSTEDGKRTITMSDDHSLWTKFGEIQWWGTYNFSHYLYEMSNVQNNDGEGPQLKEHSRILVRGRPYMHATDLGFKQCTVSYAESSKYTPDTELYHLIVDTGSYIVNGFVVSSSPKDEYYANANWKGLN
jgi:hypothetical protein